MSRIIIFLVCSLIPKNKMDIFLEMMTKNLYYNAR
jgi:hypothetical protein